MDSLLFSWISYQFPIFFMKKLWLDYPIRKFPIDSLPFARIFYGVIPFSTNSFWIYYRFRELTKNFFIYFANKQLIHYKLSKYTMDLFFFGDPDKFTFLSEFVFISLSKTRILLYRLRESTMNSVTMNSLSVASLSVSRIHY